MRQILRIEQVKSLTGLSRVTLWRMEREGKFPARVQVSTNCVGWHSDEVAEWMESRPRVGAAAGKAGV